MINTQYSLRQTFECELRNFACSSENGLGSHVAKKHAKFSEIEDNESYCEVDDDVENVKSDDDDVDPAEADEVADAGEADKAAMPA